MTRSGSPSLSKSPHAACPAHGAIPNGALTSAKPGAAPRAGSGGTTLGGVEEVEALDVVDVVSVPSSPQPASSRTRTAAVMARRMGQAGTAATLQRLRGDLPGCRPPSRPA